MFSLETMNKIRALAESGDREAIEQFLQSEEAAEFQRSVGNAWNAIEGMFSVYADFASSFFRENENFRKFIAELNKKAD